MKQFFHSAYWCGYEEYCNDYGFLNFTLNSYIMEKVSCPAYDLYRTAMLWKSLSDNESKLSTIGVTPRISHVLLKLLPGIMIEIAFFSMRTSSFMRYCSMALQKYLNGVINYGPYARILEKN